MGNNRDVTRQVPRRIAVWYSRGYDQKNHTDQLGQSRWASKEIGICLREGYHDRSSGSMNPPALVSAYNGVWSATNTNKPKEIEAERRPKLSTVQTEGNTATCFYSLPYSSLSRTIQMATWPSPPCTSRHQRSDMEKERRHERQMKTKGPGYINFVKPGQKAKGVQKTGLLQ